MEVQKIFIEETKIADGDITRDLHYVIYQGIGIFWPNWKEQ